MRSRARITFTLDIEAVAYYKRFIVRAFERKLEECRASVERGWESHIGND
jgi:hypothetical protein